MALAFCFVVVLVGESLPAARSSRFAIFRLPRSLCKEAIYLSLATFSGWSQDACLLIAASKASHRHTSEPALALAPHHFTSVSLCGVSFHSLPSQNRRVHITVLMLKAVCRIITFPFLEERARHDGRYGDYTLVDGTVLLLAFALLSIIFGVVRMSIYFKYFDLWDSGDWELVPWQTQGSSTVRLVGLVGASVAFLAYWYYLGFFFSFLWHAVNHMCRGQRRNGGEWARGALRSLVGSTFSSFLSSILLLAYYFADPHFRGGGRVRGGGHGGGGEWISPASLCTLGSTMSHFCMLSFVFKLHFVKGSITTQFDRTIQKHLKDYPDTTALLCAPAYFCCHTAFFCYRTHAQPYCHR